ncbi:MAG: permease [Phycisphaerales bacterium]
MSNKNSVVSIFTTQDLAEAAIKTLRAGGIDLKRMSLMGRGYHSEQHVVGYYTAGDRMRVWGSTGAFWGGMWGLLFGSAFFWLPGVGPLMLAGPIVAWIIGALEGAVVVGGLSALGAALYSIGVPNDSILEYETAIKAEQIVLVVDGTPEDVQKAERILHGTGAVKTTLHIGSAVAA